MLGAAVLGLLGGCSASGLLVVPTTVTLAEEQSWSLAPWVSGADVRLAVTGLPPGASWDESAGRLAFTPDATQGGQEWSVVFRAWSEDGVAEHTVEVEVQDTIAPPAPSVTASTDQGDHVLYQVSQRVDSWLDAPGWVDRNVRALVAVPTGEHSPGSLPVVLDLHGLGGELHNAGSPDRIRVTPYDPQDSGWWGYTEGLPERESAGDSVPYTRRRVLHLLAWVLDTWPQADPERVYLRGGSMGGTGALGLGLEHARHFAGVQAQRAQTVPGFHAPSRLAGLERLWGSPEAGHMAPDGSSPWESQDLGRALIEQAGAQDQWLFLRHGHDDDIIHYAALTGQSPLTGRSFQDLLQAYAVGHYLVWDEAGHAEPDPVLGEDWWDDGWDPLALLARDRSFPAFSRSSLDEEPGDGTANGRRDWDADRGYAGNPLVAGDTGWSGAVAGAQNRFLRWDPESLEDSWETWRIALCAVSGPGSEAPAAGYPSVGNRRDSTQPVTVDVTPRRVQHFRLLPGEAVAWTAGDQGGQAVADDRGVVTVPGVRVGAHWTELELVRK